VYWPGSIVPESVCVNVRNRPHRVTAEVLSPGEGVLLAMGTTLGGWSLHVLDGRLRYVHNYVGKEVVSVASATPVPAGPSRLGFEYLPAGDGGGTARLFVDERDLGEVRIPRATPGRYSITGGGLTCGWEQGPPVGSGYQAPFAFTGQLRRVVVDVDGAVHRDLEAEFEAIMSEQ